MIENNTGDASLDHWRSALSEWLITDFSQSKYIDVLSGDRLLNIMKRLNLLEVKKYDSTDLKSVSVEAGVNHILKASLSKPGNIFRVDYTLYEMKTGDSVGSDFVMGEGEESFPSMVDDLTKKIKSNFRLSSEEIASDNDKEVGKITTSYPEAYKYYNEGRKYHLSSDFRQSIPFMERAIAIDPEFAMAYRSLGSAHLNMGNRAEAIKNLTKSFELSDRTSDKERYWIIGDYYRIVERDYDKAIEAYNKLFELDPDNGVAHNNIALLFASREEWDNAITDLEVNRKNKAEFLGSYTNLGFYYEAKGMYQEAREACQDYINNFSDNALIHASIASSYAFEGKYELALKEVDKALELDPTVPNPKGQIYHLQGDFDAAEKEYKGYLEKEEVPWKMNGYRWLEYLYRMLGQYDKAKKEAQAGLKYAEEIDHSNWKRIFYAHLANSDLNDGNWEGVLEKAEFIWDSAVKDESPGWQSTALWLKIQGHLQQNNIEKAVAVAGEAKKILDKTPSTKDIYDHFDNLGLIEMKKGNYPKAIDLFTQAYELLAAQRSFTDPHAYYLFNLASAYYLNGDMEMAKKKFEGILALTSGRLADGDLYIKSFFMLGKIHEQQGNRAKAIEHYDKFLTLWKDADPGIAEVEDVRKRLVG